MVSLTTDYIKGRGNPEPYLKAIAEAGFSHVHWCHHWNSDFLYSAPEIEQINDWLKEHNLLLLDLHASAGVEKNWASSREYERLAGVELVGNRLHMANRLACETIILHVPGPPGNDTEKAVYPDQVRRSLDEMQIIARPLGVRIALENLIGDDFVLLRELLSEYSPDFLGLCYDSGHGNLDGMGLDQLETLIHRLISVHLHDNDGRTDQHRLIMDGTIDWQRLAALMAQSSYEKCVSSESSIHNTGIADENEFLVKAFESCSKLSEMIAEEKARA